MDPSSTMPSWRSGRIHGFCVTGGHLPIASEPTPSPRLWATAPGATPAWLCNHTMRVSNRPSKPELSTWPGIGTFYLAPTSDAVDAVDAVDRSNLKHTEYIPRNVLFAYHAQRDPAAKSRTYFGNCGLWIQPGGDLATRLFSATHAAMRGLPWTGDHPSVTVVSPRQDGPFIVRTTASTTAAWAMTQKPTITREQDEWASAKVKEWMWRALASMDCHCEPRHS